MKNIATVVLASTLIVGCSSLPSYHEMSCSDLVKKEKSLQKDLKFNRADSVLAGIVDIAKDTTESTVDSISADVDLKATKDEIREVQAVIAKKRCKK
jgi:uncharacterized protein YcfL